MSSVILHLNYAVCIFLNTLQPYFLLFKSLLYMTTYAINRNLKKIFNIEFGKKNNWIHCAEVRDFYILLA